MKIVLISNALTPHQLHLCDCISKTVSVDFIFIEDAEIDKSKLPIGWRTDSTRKYVVDFKTLKNNLSKYLDEIDKADAVIAGGYEAYPLIQQRLKNGNLTLLYSERLYKNKRELLKKIFHFIKFGLKYKRYPNLYLLSASAFAYADYHSINCFKGKAFKWGYFPQINNLNNHIAVPAIGDPFKMMFASRFIDWKHPELAVYLAERLKLKGYKCELNMFGEGPELPKIANLIAELKVEDIVHLRGTIPNAEILNQMSQHHAFIFTSDQNEGWGAVANEAMGQGCVLVAASNIGSVPYLVKNRDNGCIFKNGDLKSLEEQVEWLINNPQERINIAQKGSSTIHTTWSASQAANNLIALIHDLKDSKPSSISEGPCSSAEILSNNWFN